ncbi:class I SAM-dependent methyltransferase [Candidatus Poribacteria bacterium]
MNLLERWVRENFQVVEVDSVSHIYAGEGPPSWRRHQPELERELDPAQPSDWWRMVCLMDLCSSLKPDMRVLDIGCGPGWPCIPLAAYVKEIVAVDASELAISLISQNIDRRRVPNVKVQYADAVCLPFDDMIFDAVIASDLMDVVPDPDKVASEMLRVLKPEGAMVSWVQNFRWVRGERSEGWRHYISSKADALAYTCRFATLEPPQGVHLLFRVDPLDPLVKEMDLPAKPTFTTADSTITVLRRFRPALDDHVEFYRAWEFVPETAVDPFAAAGFTDLTVSPLCLEMCHAFAVELAKQGMPPENLEEFRATASALLSAMQYADFHSSCEISVKGKRPRA